jgi:hypothetical protein
MIKKILSILAILIGFISCNLSDKKTPPTTSSTSSLESNIKNPKSYRDKEIEYLKVRNKYIKYFENSPDEDKSYKQNEDSLLVLDKMLKEILKDSQTEKFINKGSINLETLLNEQGFGMLDGIILNKEYPNYFKTVVTSKGLFFEYFKSEPISSLDNLTSKKLSLIFNSIISEASTTIFYSEKIHSKKYNNVYGCIGTVSQDIGPFSPDHIFVLIANEDYVFLIGKYTDKPLKENIQCQAIYDSITLISKKHQETYRASNLKNKTAFNKHIELEETAWKKYCECYHNNFKNDNIYNDVHKQLEKIVRDFEKK